MNVAVLEEKKAQPAGILLKLRGDQRGNVVMLTAIAVPTLLISMFAGTSVMMALAQKQQLVSVAKSACNRAIKPQRTVILEDEDRQRVGQAAFDAFAADKKFKVVSRSVTAGWLQARVQARATVQVMPGLGLKLQLPISVDTTCKGIPPYPALGDVIMSSNFKTPTGDALQLPMGGGRYSRWGLFNATVVGWDGGGGYGVEIQDWSSGYTTSGTPETKLPPGVSNPFVVELDSGSNDQNTPVIGGLNGLNSRGEASTCNRNYNFNSSMYKTLELHPGRYRFSLWYRARYNWPKGTPAANSNELTVTMEGVRPVSQEVTKLVIDNQDDMEWEYHYFDIPVDSYGIYKFWVKATGCGDSVGGLFNDLQLTYIQRPYPEYNDPLPAPPSGAKR